MTTTVRRLAAIAVIDVVGYSTMTAEDEEGTHAALIAHRNDIDPILLNHGCRVVKSTGDGYLVEIPSVVEALQAAVEIQQLMAERNASVPDNRSLEIRIGINLGDIIIDDDGDIYGDGVNVAARLEGLADPGGICVSESVRQQVGNRLEVDFEDMGEVEVKNIPGSVHAWRVMLDGQRTPVPTVRSGDYRLATVAVLPFDNMSGSSDDEYLADGITEDLITAPRSTPRSSGSVEELHFRLQGRGARHPARCQTARRHPCRRGQRPQGGRTDSDHRPAHRGRRRPSHLGRALRSPAQRRLRAPGRDRA